MEAWTRDSRANDFMQREYKKEMSWESRDDCIPFYLHSHSREDSFPYIGVDRIYTHVLRN